jgi:hypothetical protein
MSKKTKKTATALPAGEPATPTATTEPAPPAADVVAAPPAEPKPERAPKVPDTRVFSVTEQPFTPGKGFATELYAVMKSVEGATPQQAAEALLASGAYQRVAPKAAELRPVKPVETLLKQWLAKGVVTAK